MTDLEKLEIARHEITCLNARWREARDELERATGTDRPDTLASLRETNAILSRDNRALRARIAHLEPDALSAPGLRRATLPADRGRAYGLA